jgi:limonene 1,2-monooxygenase
VSRLRFGVFITPYHQPAHNVVVQFEEDLRLAEHLDRLGFDEVWFGEHHSTGFECIAAPDLMALAAAQRTRHIRLGLGVTTVPYHHPFLLTERMIQLDHLTRGRVTWGIGTGSVVQDAAMLGLDPQDLRRMAVEGVQAISDLLRFEEPVTTVTDWFEMHEASLQLQPYSEAFDIRIAATVSPSGPRLAGQFGHGLFQFASTGEGLLANTFDIWQQGAAEFGHEPDRDRWSVLHFVYLADTEAQAREDMRWGMKSVILERLSVPGVLGDTPPEDLEEMIDALSDKMLIGTPEMAVRRIQEIQEASGGIGTFIIGNFEGAEPRKVERSFELFARHVIPHFNGQRDHRLRAKRRSLAFSGNGPRLKAAQEKATADWEVHKSEMETK